MQGLYELPSYSKALTEYSHNMDWRCFTPVHLERTIQKCPICEVKLDKSVERETIKGKKVTIKATIDHYRPTKYYGFLGHNHQNFLLMCLDCNQHYKQNSFPLYPEGSQRAINNDQIDSENPLIINPIYDNPTDFFKLIFKIYPDGRKTLELRQKENLNPYFDEKAKTTVELFKLDNCKIDENHPIDQCRINIQSINFELFFKLANARKDKTKFVLTLKENPTLKTYGFFVFIMMNQFEIEGMVE